MLQSIPYIDTHTGGEPTRIVLSLPVDIPPADCAQAIDFLRTHHDGLRQAILCEPRGSDVLVGAILLPAAESDASLNVIFANNVGYLGMCGHGTIGLAVALKHAGRISDGQHQMRTVVGEIPFTLDGSKVSLQNVPSYRHAKHVAITLDDGQVVHGDVAWGGNWFFVSGDHGQQLESTNIPALSDFARRVRRRLDEVNYPLPGGGCIDHVELIGPPSSTSVADARNFTLCPGGAYDRSPCGTGTSAKAACLAADGKLQPGQVWRQESIVGSVFEASYCRATESDLAGQPLGSIIPTITGSAYVCGQGELLLDPNDPFRMGIPS